MKQSQSDAIMKAAILEKITDVWRNSQPLSFLEIHELVADESQIYSQKPNWYNTVGFHESLDTKWHLQTPDITF